MIGTAADDNAATPNKCQQNSVAAMIVIPVDWLLSHSEEETLIRRKRKGEGEREGREIGVAPREIGHVLKL